MAAAHDEPLYHWILAHPQAWPVRVLSPLRESAPIKLYKLGTGAYLIPLSTATYLIGVASKSRALRDTGMGCLAGDLTIAGVRQTIFLFLTRERPVNSPDDPFRFGFPGRQDPTHQSFFSGHVANSMACASFTAHRFSLNALEPVFYTFVTAIGAGRIVDGQHWLSDTMMGGMFGWVVGRTISGRFAARDRAATPNISTLPIRVSFTF
jgi:membrane-associated phospholipid phosphatase